MSIPEPVRRLLAKYPSIIRSETLPPTPTHGVDTGGNRPVFAKARRLAPDKLRIAEAEFKKLEAAGIYHPQVQLRLGVPPPHGGQEGRLLETLRRMHHVGVTIIED